jgi:hypothetical protein
MEQQIVVLAATSQEQLENDGCDVEQECQTIAEAKKRAKYYLTEEYMNSCESTTRLEYAVIKVNGKAEYDFFGKGK